MQVCFLGLEDPLKKEMTTHSSILPSVKWLPDQTDNLAYYPGLQETGCFPSGSLAKNPPANAGDARDVGSIPGSGRSPGVGNGNPLQYSCLENSMDRGAWQATVHVVAKNWT